MNDICKWACFQRQTVVILGDLNMNTLRANSGEGKILSDRGIEQLALHRQRTNQNYCSLQVTLGCYSS